MNSNAARRMRHGALLPWLGLTLFTMCGCSQTVIESDNSRKAIDALYTAVTSRRTELVDACERRLKDLSTAGEIPSSTTQRLTKIIAQTRDQQWQPAAERLNELILQIAP